MLSQSKVTIISTATYKNLMEREYDNPVASSKWLVCSPHNEMPGLIPGPGWLLYASFFTLIAYVDPAITGYLDVRRMVNRILGTYRRCGVVDNVSYVQGPAQPLVIIHHPYASTASLSKGWGV